MIPKKPAPDLIRGGNRFSDKIMLNVLKTANEGAEGRAVAHRFAARVDQEIDRFRRKTKPRRDGVQLRRARAGKLVEADAADEEFQAAAVPAGLDADTGAP